MVDKEQQCAGGSATPADDGFTIGIATEKHLRYVDEILQTTEKAAKARGTGIAKRTPEALRTKILDGRGVIAMHGDDFAGFCYVEPWENDTFVTNSGLIVKPDYRGHGLAKRIKLAAFRLCRRRFPQAKIIGFTSGAAVMKINTELGYVPVTFDSLPHDPAFWKGCEACINFDVLSRNDCKRCICTGMLYDPATHTDAENNK